MHHKRDWKQYNKQLVNRGKIHFWIHPKIFTSCKAGRKKKNGHPFVYSNEVIEAMCYIRFKFHLSLRETEGFFLSCVELLKTVLRVPCYTQLCRRMKNLSLPNELLNKKDVTDVVLDTTGLKVFGEGQWRAEKYGGKRSWKKLHLAMDVGSGKLVLAEITDEYSHDTTYFEKALAQANLRRGKILMDGIADSQRCYEMAKQHNKELLTPPKRRAVIRNEAIKIIRGFGGDLLARSIWSKLVGYNRRVMIESMISRWKRLYGGSLSSRSEARRLNEVKIKALMINKMIENQAA